MTASKDFTWDFDLVTTPNVPARAASLADVGDAALVDKAASPPVPPTMPYAAMLNQWMLQLAGINRIIPAIDIEIQFSGGNPVIQNVMAMSSIITTSYAQSNFTVTHVGAGTVKITWPAGTLPPPRGKARAYVLSGGLWLQPVTTAISNGVEVQTYDSGGNLLDAAFAVQVY